MTAIGRTQLLTRHRQSDEATPKNRTEKGRKKKEQQRHKGLIDNTPLSTTSRTVPSSVTDQTEGVRSERVGCAVLPTCNVHEVTGDHVVIDDSAEKVRKDNIRGDGFDELLPQETSVHKEHSSHEKMPETTTAPLCQSAFPRRWGQGREEKNRAEHSSIHPSTCSAIPATQLPWTTLQVCKDDDHTLLIRTLARTHARTTMSPGRGTAPRLARIAIGRHRHTQASGQSQLTPHIDTAAGVRASAGACLLASLLARTHTQ